MPVHEPSSAFSSPLTRAWWAGVRDPLPACVAVRAAKWRQRGPDHRDRSAAELCLVAADFGTRTSRCGCSPAPRAYATGMDTQQAMALGIVALTAFLMACRWHRRRQHALEDGACVGC